MYNNEKDIPRYSMYERDSDEATRRPVRVVAYEDRVAELKCYKKRAYEDRVAELKCCKNGTFESG